jgi:hypothetical protein
MLINYTKVLKRKNKRKENSSRGPAASGLVATRAALQPTSQVRGPAGLAVTRARPS